MEEKEQENKTSVYISRFLYCCIGLGVILHIVPYFYNRSLWIDEAMLASSICTRSFASLIASPLDWGQSAPIGWLFIVKTLTALFGTSEAVLRCWSLVASFACIIVLYLLLKDKIRKNYALLFTALFSLTDKFIYYGNEVKSYMTDNLCCLLTLYIWQKYREKKISLLKMTIVFSVLIWFSFSAVFFIAACMVIEGVSVLRTLFKEKEIKQGIIDLLKCALVLSSFVLNYIIWLSKTAGNAAGTDYWDLIRFPAIPRSLNDIKLIPVMGAQVLAFYPGLIAILLFVLFLIYIIKAVKSRQEKSYVLVPTVISVVFLLVASYCGFYPMQDRLLQIYGIVVLIFCAILCEDIEKSDWDKVIKHTKCNKIRLLYHVVLAEMLIVLGVLGCRNLFPEFVYEPSYEVAESMNYLDENLKDDDVVYVYRLSIPVFTYETDFKVDYNDLIKLPRKDYSNKDYLSGLPYQNDGVIWGQELYLCDYKIPYSYAGYLDTEAVMEDAELIKNNKSVYLFTSHGEGGVPDLIKELRKYGKVSTVVDYYDTHLYHYEVK